MKNQYYILLTLLVGLTISHYGHGQVQQAELVGTWTFDYQASLDKMRPSTIVHFDTIDLAQRTQIIQAYTNRKVTFTQDGGFIQVLSDGRRSLGTWTIIGSGNVLQITDPSGKHQVHKIHQINQNTLVIKPEDEINSKLFFPEWHFIKN